MPEQVQFDLNTPLRIRSMREVARGIAQTKILSLCNQAFQARDARRATPQQAGKQDKLKRPAITFPFAKQ
jgi:hypothetical protein